MGQVSFNDLYSVVLKATYNMRIGNREIEAGEVITIMDHVLVAGLKEIVSFVAARGGYGNPAHVFWEQAKELQLTFDQGVFNKDHYALMVNSEMLEIANNTIELFQSESLQSDGNREIELKYVPTRDLYIYKENGDRINNYSLNGKKVWINIPYANVVADYVFEYDNGGQFYKIGSSLVNGFVSLEAHTRVKDDETGRVVTGIIKIPKLKLLSDFSIRLGRQINPTLGKLNAVGMPVGQREKYVCEFYVLDDDIDSDI